MLRFFAFSILISVNASGILIIKVDLITLFQEDTILGRIPVSHDRTRVAPTVLLT